MSIISDVLNHQALQSRAPAQTAGRPRRRNNQVARSQAAPAPNSWGYNGPPISTTGAVPGETSHQREVRILNNIRLRRRRGGFSQQPQAGGMDDQQAYVPSSPALRARFGPNGQPLVSPGSGNVVYHDDQYNPDPGTRANDDAWLGRIMRNNPPGSGMNGAGTTEVGIGPYGSLGRSGLGRFNSLGGGGGAGGGGGSVGLPQQPRRLPPAGHRYGGGTEMIQMPDGRMVGVSPEFAGSAMNTIEGASPAQRNTIIAGHYANSRPGSTEWEANRVGAINARGGNQVYVDGGFRNATPEQQAAGQRQQDKADLLRQGRRDRAIRRYGLDHLTPSYATAPQDAMRYGRSASYQQPTPEQERDLKAAAHVARNTSDDGTDWVSTTRSMFASKDFRNNPRDAWPALEKSGMTVEDIDELIDEADGVFGFFNDPVYEAQLKALRDAAVNGPGIDRRPQRPVRGARRAPPPSQQTPDRPLQGPSPGPMYRGPFAGW